MEKVTKKSSKYQGFRNWRSFVDNVDNVDYLMQIELKKVRHGVSKPDLYPPKMVYIKKRFRGKCG